MESFKYSLANGSELNFRQSSTGSIGAKVYPGSLLMGALIEQNLTPLHAVAIELGCGACPIPTLLAARQGVNAVATDLEAMLGLCRSNISANEHIVPAESAGAPRQGATDRPSESVPARAAVLPWGDLAAASALRESLGASSIGMIVGADVVYHDHLLLPLLETLADLTDPPAGEQKEQYVPPPVVLTYVQRFKRAKAFFKMAQRGVHRPAQAHGVGRDARGAATGGVKGPKQVARFEVEQVLLGYVVDYDTLSWVLPMASGLGGGESGKKAHASGGYTPQAATGTIDTPQAILPAATPMAVNLTGNSSSYMLYCDLLIRAAAAAKPVPMPAGDQAEASAGRQEGSPVAGDVRVLQPVTSGTTAPVAAHARHRIDSDSGDEWDDSAGYASGLLSGLAGMAVDSTTEGEGQAEGKDGEDDAEETAGAQPCLLADHVYPPRTLIQRARAAAAVLGLRFADPLKAYKVTLRRKL